MQIILYCYFEGKRPYTREHTLQDTISTKFQKKKKQSTVPQIVSMAASGQDRLTSKECEGTFQNDRNFILTGRGWLHGSVQLSKPKRLRSVHFTKIIPHLKDTCTKNTYTMNKIHKAFFTCILSHFNNHISAPQDRHYVHLTDEENKKVSHLSRQSSRMGSLKAMACHQIP